MEFLLLAYQRSHIRHFRDMPEIDWTKSGPWNLEINLRAMNERVMMCLSEYYNCEFMISILSINDNAYTEARCE